MDYNFEQSIAQEHSCEFLTEQQLSKRWQLSARTLQQSRWKGVGCPYLKIGRAVRYRLADVLKFESNQVMEVGLQHGQH